MNASRSQGALAPEGRCIFCGDTTQPLTLTISGALRTWFHATCQDQRRAMRERAAAGRQPTPISVLLVRELRELGASMAAEGFEHGRGVCIEAADRLEERLFAAGGAR